MWRIQSELAFDHTTFSSILLYGLIEDRFGSKLPKQWSVLN